MNTTNKIYRMIGIIMGFIALYFVFINNSINAIIFTFLLIIFWVIDDIEYKNNKGILKDG